MWESLIPGAVERARQTYAHTTDCSYTTLSHAHRTLCCCGKGKDLPEEFKRSMKTTSTDPADEGPPLHSLMYRAALSPLYAPIHVACLASVGVRSTSIEVGVSATRRSSKCAICGKTGQSMQCARCRSVCYCSKECQRKDWKRHKSACG
ncbi:unnamed protein product [Hapterophycus canaliculatus]